MFNIDDLFEDLYIPKFIELNPTYQYSRPKDDKPTITTISLPTPDHWVESAESSSEIILPSIQVIQNDPNYDTLIAVEYDGNLCYIHHAKYMGSGDPTVYRMGYRPHVYTHMPSEDILYVLFLPGLGVNISINKFQKIEGQFRRIDDESIDISNGRIFPIPTDTLKVYGFEKGICFIAPTPMAGMDRLMVWEDDGDLNCGKSPHITSCYGSINDPYESYGTDAIVHDIKLNQVISKLSTELPDTPAGSCSMDKGDVHAKYDHILNHTLTEDTNRTATLQACLSELRNKRILKW